MFYWTTCNVQQVTTREMEGILWMATASFVFLIITATGGWESRFFAATNLLATDILLQMQAHGRV